MSKLSAYTCALCTWFAAYAAQADATRVCVEVVEKQWVDAAARPSGAPADAAGSTESQPTPAPQVPTPLSRTPPATGEEPAPKQEPASPSIVALEPPPKAEPAAQAVTTPVPRDPESKMSPKLPAGFVAAPVSAPSLDPQRYLKRLLEYQVTHHTRYEAVQEECNERLVVELYALEQGWTVFARFSEFAREEKIDHVELDEFGALADRLARALLSDTSVQLTLDRENVLRADSEEDIRRVRGQTHFALSMGTALRLSRLPSATGSSGSIRQRYRVASPLTLSIGARNKFRGWALDPFARAQLGTSEYVPESANEPGGHVDFGGSGALGLHFLRYTNPRGIGSFYFGGGAQFELARYKVTEAGKRGRSGEHDGLWSGGLDMDLLGGYEFMRASTLHFFVQLELSLPAYTVSGQTKSGGLDNAYTPSAVLQVGLLL
jgi:hypothetical protein